MPNFVRDNTALNNGKSDFAPSGAPANQSLTAPEWNTAEQDKADLRNELLSALYHGWEQSASAVSAANKARIRLNTLNRLQASMNAGAYKSLTVDGLYVGDYGAVGDGVTNDAVAIQACVDAALSAGKAVIFDAKTYLVNSEISVKGANLTIISQGKARTVLKAGAAMRAVLRLGVDSAETGTQANGTFMHGGITIDGNRNAKYGLMFLQCGNGRFDNIYARKCTFDGVYMAQRTTDDSVLCNNDANLFLDLDASVNGTIIGTTEFDDPTDANPDTRHVGYFVGADQFQLTAATVSRTSGSNILTGSGTTFLTWGIRAGDPIRVGVSPNTEYFVVQSVDSETQLTLAKNSGITSGTQPWSVGRGSGYWEDGHTDNNINKFLGGLFRSNAGYAFGFRGIYGPTMSSVFIDYHRYWGIRVGINSEQYYSGGTTLRTAGGFGGPVITSHFNHVYFEAIGRKPFYFRSAIDCNVEHPMDFGYDGDPYDSNPADVNGMYTNKRGVHDIGIWEYQSEGATIYNFLPSKLGKDFFILGKAYVDSSQFAHGTAWAVGTTLPLTKTTCILDPNGSNRTITATPHFTLENNRTVTIINKRGGGGDIVIQDDSVLPGSGMQLNGSANVTLTPGSTISFYCDGSYWYEKGRSIR